MKACSVFLAFLGAEFDHLTRLFPSEVAGWTIVPGFSGGPNQPQHAGPNWPRRHLGRPAGPQVVLGERPGLSRGAERGHAGDVWGGGGTLEF
jgi:hypothetical protein